MTVYIGVCQKDRVELLTDSAIYDQEGVVHGFHEKIIRVPGQPVAITTRGGLNITAMTGQDVAELIDRYGFDEAMVRLSEQFDEFCEVAPGQAFEIAIAGVSASAGPIIYFGGSHPMGGLDAHVLHSTRFGVSCGAPFLTSKVPQQIAQRGGLGKVGVAMMNACRSRSGVNPLNRDGPTRYVCGGHVDLTTITAGGATTRRIHDWHDKIGEKINPFVGQNVVPIGAATAGMNRQQRRAIQRLQVKRRA